MIQPRIEFRFLIDKSILEGIHIVPKEIVIIDYYLEREKRIRYIKEHPNVLQENTYHMISVPPGCVYKYPKMIDESEAKTLASWKNVKYLVRKKLYGLTEFNIGATSLIKGATEHIIAERIIDKSGSYSGEVILDEIQIEFETYGTNIERLKQLIKPISIIENGIYNYIEERLRIK